MGIAEQNMVTFAAGLASCGFMPFATGYGGYLPLNKEGFGVTLVEVHRLKPLDTEGIM